MKKKIFLFAVLAIMFAGGAFAQNHWISAELTSGAGLRYEYVITPSFTVGGYFTFMGVTIPLMRSTYTPKGGGRDSSQLNSIQFGATARWYPFAGKFFAELNVGYNIFTYGEGVFKTDGWSSWYEWTRIETSGFCIAPGLGWTIDLGQMGAFFLAPSVKFPITFGGKDYYGGNYFNITITPYLGLGYAF